MQRKELQTMTILGVEWESESADQVIGTCPFCGKRMHFYASTKTALWDCKRCGKSGNIFDFLTEITQAKAGNLSKKDLHILKQTRGLDEKSYTAWGIFKIGDEYYLPEYNPRSGMVTSIQAWSPGKRPRTLPGTKHGVFMPNDVSESGVVWLCEGIWDAIALWECLRSRGKNDIVYGLPGATTFPKSLISTLAKKDVRVVFDNDKGGEAGQTRAVMLLKPVAGRLTLGQWPDGIPNGFDIRDLALKYGTSSKRMYKAIRTLIGGNNRHPTTTKRYTREEVYQAFSKWLSLPGDEILQVVFGTCIANKLPKGDPVWMFIVAPPGGTKSEVLMSLTDGEQIETITTLTPHSLISGMILQGGGDPSLLATLDGKILVIKDFTAIIGMNPVSRDEILSLLRDAYDGRCEKRFATGIVRRYEVSFGLLAGVTPAIDGISRITTLLGERFLKYRPIGKRVEAIERALQNMIKGESMRTELKTVAKTVVDADIRKIPTIQDDIAKRLVALARWVAALRGAVMREGYSGRVMQKPVPEYGTRLVKQLGKLALGIAIYCGKKEVDFDVWEVVKKVGKDCVTAHIEEMFRLMYSSPEHLSVVELARKTQMPFESTKTYVEDLCLLGVLEPSELRGRYKVSNKMKGLTRYLEMYPKRGRK